ncbi:MAG: aldehyde dehydrogenase [Clostridia bacterium]|nr:aldehyde dehydrogenase [Clostridia bacterium]
MQEQEIARILTAQRAYFESGATYPVQARINALKRLQTTIRQNAEEICEALEKDLGKSRFEGYTCEVGMALDEIGYMLKNLKKFARPKRVKTPLAQFASKSFVLPTPRGNTLIVSPWNYPFLLAVDPLVDSLAAGNTAIVKPSAYSPHTSALLEKLLNACFSEELVAVVTGGREENACLLKQKFDFIFFTGSQAVGREVLKRAAEHLTPVALELGGKSPCIVDETANIPLAAKRIVFGKYLNCGQTCVAPDYILCDKRVKDRLVAEIVAQIKAQFGAEPLENPDYGKMINEKHFARVLGLINAEKTVFGGGSDKDALRIEPTVLDGVEWSDAVMREEIFGPVLPVLTFADFDEVYPLLADKQKPLALYLFTSDKRRAKQAFSRLRFGGGCINDTVIHLATTSMGFGGVGESGMGAYHGKTGFDLFSHQKSVVDKKTWLDLPIRYQPYTKAKEKWVRRFLK